VKYALITGASSGIGSEFAKLLARKGYSLILVARRKERLLQLKDQIQEKQKVHIIIKDYDLSNIDNCYQLHKECKDYPIHLLINNAGFGKAGESIDIKDEYEIEMIQTNIISLQLLTKLFCTSMDSGTILNVASMAGFMPDPLMATYGATKSYVIQLSRAINYELKKSSRKVRISILCPGPVETEFQQVANQRQKKAGGVIGRIYNKQLLTSKDCVEIAWNGLNNGKEVIYVKKTDRFLSVIIKLLPTAWLIPVQYYIQKNKID
jgi:short-subunit dehydrogenase